jgi:hypothetical protein
MGHDLQHDHCWTIACRERNTLVYREAFEVFQPTIAQLTTEQVICEREILCEFAVRLN